MTITDEIVLGAYMAYSNGEIELRHLQRTLALCSLWAQGIEKPTTDQIDWRISELNTAASFISSAETIGQ